MENTIIHGNALEELRKIPSESIDLVCVDPPYKIRSRGNTLGSGNLATELSKKGKIFKNNDINIEDWLPDIYRVLKDGTHCYIMVNNFNLIHYLNVINESGFHFIRLLVWDKKRKIMGTKYMGQIEFIIMCSKGKNRNINDYGVSDLLSVPINKLKDKNGKNLHDTEKPIGLMETLVTESSDKGDIVLDPFCGIGSTLIAAKKHERRYVGIEIDESYYNIALKRLKGVQNEPNLFSYE